MVPGTVPFSIALGDCSHPDDVAQAVAAVPVRAGGARCYIKLGFAGIASPQRVRALLEEARNSASRHSTPQHVVAVAYADAELTGSIGPDRLCRAAVDSEVTAVLIDTQLKGSGNLLTRVSLPALTRLVAQARRGGLLAALAGSLDTTDLALVGAAGPDILGFRGAVCTGGRDGVVSRSRVEQLRHAMASFHSDFVRNKDRRALGETPDGPANLSLAH